MKKLLAILVAAFMLLSLAAVAEETTTIGYILSDLANPFFVTLEEGIKTECEANGFECVGYDSANDAAKDLENMDTLIQLGVSAILYNPVDSETGVAVVEKANEAGIPVLTIDRSVNGGEVVCHIASDNVYGAEIGCQFILEKLGEAGGQVAEIQGMAGASAANERHEGFENIMGAAENIEVVSSQIGDWDQTKAQEIMTNVLTASPEVKAVFCANDNMALGAIEACKIAGREDIVIVGFDAIDDAVAAVEEGTLAATIQQLPGQIGVVGVQNAVKVLNGEAVDAFIGVEVQLVTK